MDYNTADLTTPCNVCTPWRYSRQDSTLRRWDYAQLRWERIATEDQILTRSNDTLFLTNGGFVVLPAAQDLTGIRDTVAGLYDIIMNGDTNTANVLRIFVPTSAITSRGGDPKAPTDSIMTAVALAYQLAGQARPGSILVSQVAATSSNPSHQAPSLNSSTPFNVWFWDGLRVTRISYGLVAIDIQDTLAGGLNTTVIDPAPDATEASILDFIDNNYESLSMPNGTLLYLKGDGDDVNPDTIWVVLDNVSDATKRVVLLKSKAVNSVTMALPPDFAVVNSNTSGAVLNSASWIAQGESEVLIGPISAPDSVPVFRRLQISDLPASGVTANTYARPTSVSVNSKGQVTAITAGTAGVDTIFVHLMHTEYSDTLSTDIAGTAFVVPSSLNGAQVIAASYRTVTNVTGGTLSVFLVKISTGGTTSNALFDTIVVGDNYEQTTGSLTINTGDLLMLRTDNAGDANGYYATVKIIR